MLINAIIRFLEADLARSLLLTISNDIGQIASLYAMMHGLKKVIDFFNVQPKLFDVAMETRLSRGKARGDHVAL